jgi:uncharacterized repeat protein (TIGR03843 family)
MMLNDHDTILDKLAIGEISVVGQLTWSSNYTFLARVKGPGWELPAIYKPSEGESPLWDFPQGSLACRELAAYLVSESLGWELVPPTILRDSGPAGPGSLQFFIDADPDRHYFTFSKTEKQSLRPAAIFDILINNADRKGGHVLLSDEDHIWLIDHGVCFHEEYKLRTVIWDFIGEEIPGSILTQLDGFRERLLTDVDLQKGLSELLSAQEFAALADRVDWLLQSRCFPPPGTDRPYPWPVI